VIALFVYGAMQPGGLTRVAKYSFVAGSLGAMVLLSPFGKRIIDTLPFVGTVDVESVTYRQRLAELSWQLIQQHPLLGNPFVLTQMEELRQGQGIIDLVNSYASIALLYGLAGLALFLAVFVIGMVGAYRASRRWADDHDVAALGACLVATMIATLFMMATGSFGTILAQTYWLMAGLAGAYGQLQLEEQRPAEPARPDWPAPARRPAGAFNPTGVLRVRE
jgi:O-antigen ligase